jgi:UDP-N-acetylmuramoyl-L-alanyl-D-glutamate--2,6-diaminopimelate ligase
MHGGKLIVVSGSAGERDAVKRPLQGEVMAELADIVIITSEDPRNEDPMAIIHDIEVGTAGGRAQVYSIEDRREAITLAFSKAEPGDVVLLAGKGHETSIIWGFEHRPWDEAAVARELLAPYAVR